MIDRFTAHVPRDDLNFELRRELDAIDNALQQVRNALLAKSIMRQKEYSA
jgi:hypothetical protein